MSLQRTFNVTERVRMEFQAHAHNVFNHTQFSPSYNAGWGGTEVGNNPASGQLPGATQNANYGTHTTATYDARNLELVLKVRF